MPGQSGLLSQETGLVDWGFAGFWFGELCPQTNASMKKVAPPPFPKRSDKEAYL